MTSSTGIKTGLVYVVIVLAIVVGAELTINNAFGSSPVYVVVSRSMVPTLEVGDLVVVKSVPFSSIRVGDVIVYVTPTPLGTCEGLTIVHRVVNITSDGRLITQGDDRATNPTPDEPYEWPPIPPACVKGEVVLAVPYLGDLSMLFPPPTNYVLVAAILFIVFLLEFRGGRKSDEEKAAEKRSDEGNAPTKTG